MYIPSFVAFAILFGSTFSFAAPPRMNCSTTDVSSTELTSFIKRHHGELIQYNAKESNGKFRVSDGKSRTIREDLCRILKIGGANCDLKLSSDPQGSALGDGILAISDQGEPLFVEPAGRRMYRCTPRPDDFAYGVNDNGERRLLILAREDGSIFGVMFNSKGEAEAVRGSLLRGQAQTLFTSDMKPINLNRLKGTLDFAGTLFTKPSTDQTDQAFGHASAPTLPAAPASGTAR